MLSVDICFQNLKRIDDDFKEFCGKYGEISEADTRVKLIDRILTEVCGWPESNIKRETHSDSGYSDYILEVYSKKQVVVEAKREGKAFLFPQDTRSRSLKLNGPLLSDVNIKKAISQVRGYCDDHGIRYGIATNGYSWMVFRAIQENRSWKEGHARVYPSIQFILDNFSEFWNLLSFDLICKGSLDREFGLMITPDRKLLRVLNRLTNADTPLLRNSLHSQLYPVITNFFEDIADPNQLDKLKFCYVHSATLKTAVDEISVVIKDTLPKFLKDQRTENIEHNEDDSGVFGEAVEGAMLLSKGQLFLLLGGIGCGKTTFQKRYQLTVGKDALQNAIWFVLDFLKPPVDSSDLEPFVWRNILDQLRTRYSTPHLETRRNIKRVFRPEIEALKETELYGLREETPEYERILTKHLTKWQESLGEYVPRLLSLAKPRQNISVVLFFDNVDQLSPFYQSQIFLLAQNVTGKTGSITIVALREESYYTASVQRVFTAYINRKFHIASPPFRRMIDQRIKYVLNIFDDSQDGNSQFDSIFNDNLFYKDDKAKISDFLKIVERSIFEKNKSIGRFIDHICFGNMRMALQVFSTFLVSGATDIDKMIRIYRRDGNYFVAFHEFLRSIMLGDRMYYKESESTVLNLFECGADRNSSHFTTIRLLLLLDKIRANYHREGRGYIEINKVIVTFENSFNNVEDLINVMNRLLLKQLVEVNTKSQESIKGATHIRVTSSGWYYIRYLFNSFAYLDLCLQDTPINSDDVVEKLKQSIILVDNLGGKEDEKEARMQERFKRVDIFLNYLKMEEDQEIERFNLASNSDFLPIVDKMMTNFSDQREYITERVRINHELYFEEKATSAQTESFEGLAAEDDETGSNVGTSDN